MSLIDIVCGSRTSLIWGGLRRVPVSRACPKGGAARGNTQSCSEAAAEVVVPNFRNPAESGRTERHKTRNEPPMTSEKSNEPLRQLCFLEEEPGSDLQNIQCDDLTTAAIEKSALNDDNTLIEQVASEQKMEIAWARVKANRGAPGPDGITVRDFPEWIASCWSGVRQKLLDGTYQPSPARPDEYQHPVVQSPNRARVSGKDSMRRPMLA